MRRVPRLRAPAPAGFSQLPSDDAAVLQDLALPSRRRAPPPTTKLVYPRGNASMAPEASSVTDSAYTPAETADGLEEVGGLAGWWDNPAHWGDAERGARAFVQDVAAPFGPSEKVTDPAVLEVLARRAVVESLVVERFAPGEKNKKLVARLMRFAQAGDRIGKFMRIEVVAAPNGRVVQAAEEPAPLPTPEEAQKYIQSWKQGWRKAELKSPVVKFFIAKRIQQLTGHRIPDGKLAAVANIDGLLRQLVTPPKAKKLAELVEMQGVFDGLSNVRVFPRRVTPIDKEQMVGRWKIIVEELEKRELPVTGTNGYSKTVEKKWIEGDA
ncbi:hypothetical protein N0V88_001454 [Collariella sp. IMI 366227]|nr:hypothetical protein N0V88_001454 [Collariella sp. IMI 366227]